MVLPHRGTDQVFLDGVHLPTHLQANRGLVLKDLRGLFFDFREGIFVGESSTPQGVGRDETLPSKERVAMVFPKGQKPYIVSLKYLLLKPRFLLLSI